MAHQAAPARHLDGAEGRAARAPGAARHHATAPARGGGGAHEARHSARGGLRAGRCSPDAVTATGSTVPRAHAEELEDGQEHAIKLGYGR
jgi:hypothetical protein